MPGRLDRIKEIALADWEDSAPRSVNIRVSLKDNLSNSESFEEVFTKEGGDEETKRVKEEWQKKHGKKPLSTPQETIIPLLTSPFTVNAHIAGIAEVPKKHLITDELLQSASSAFFEISGIWAETAKGSVELFNGTTIHSFGFSAGGKFNRIRSTDILPGLTIGKDTWVRIQVTTPGAPGETIKLVDAKLIIKEIE